MHNFSTTVTVFAEKASNPWAIKASWEHQKTRESPRRYITRSKLTLSFWAAREYWYRGINIRRILREANKCGFVGWHALRTPHPSRLRRATFSRWRRLFISLSLWAFSHLATCFRVAKKILRIFVHLPPKMLTLRMTKGVCGAVKRVAEGVDPYK